MSTRRAQGLAVVGAFGCILLLGALVLDVRPQGNIARAVPYGVAAGLVVAAAAWIGWGGRAALRIAAGYIVLASLAVVGYVVALEPIPYAECGTLIEEFDNAACRGRADAKLLAAAAAVGAGALTAIAATKLRTGHAAAGKSQASPPGFAKRHDDNYEQPRPREQTTTHGDKQR